MLIEHNKMSFSKTKGISVVEVVVASTIISVFFLSLAGVYNLYIKIGARGLNTTKAAFLAEEGVEVMKFLRDTSWSTRIDPLIEGNTYYLSWNGSAWTTTTVPQYINEFERSVVLESVYRDSGGDIVVGSGTEDVNTKKVTVSIAWTDRGATTTKTVATYMTNLLNN